MNTHTNKRIIDKLKTIELDIRMCQVRVVSQLHLAGLDEAKNLAADLARLEAAGDLIEKCLPSLD